MIFVHTMEKFSPDEMGCQKNYPRGGQLNVEQKEGFGLCPSGGRGITVPFPPMPTCAWWVGSFCPASVVDGVKKSQKVRKEGFFLR